MQPPLSAAERPEPGGAAARFHRATDHLAGGRLHEHYRYSMIEELRPRPYKLYSTLDPIPLPRDFAPSTMPALDAIVHKTGVGSRERRLPDLDTIARLCFFTDGITKRLRRGEREIAFRAAPCTGALYHCELYVVCADLPGLPAGVYHYGVHDHALRRLRAGDYRHAVSRATGSRHSAMHAPLTMVTTSVFWRNAWKYANRAYRHTYWDTGTMLPNTLATATAVGLSHELVLSFADQPIADLLGFDLDREAVVSLVALGTADAPAPPAPEVIPLELPTEPYSIREIDYPLIRETHRATRLPSGADAAAWRDAVRRFVRSPEYAGELPKRADLIPLPQPNSTSLPADPIESVIRRRGSTRRFARAAISLDQFATMLYRATSGFPFDALEGDPAGVPFAGNVAYLIVQSVEGLRPGAYVYHCQWHALELVRQLTEEEARERAYVLSIEQDLGGDAAVNVYFLAALEPMLAALGDRGYRLAQLGGALVAGRLYLAAYALGLGATGLTFYDDAVIDFFSPHAAGKSVMFQIALGVPAPRSGKTT